LQRLAVMDASIMFILATMLLAVAGYAQWRIGYHTVASRVALTRGLLAAVAIAFAFVTTAAAGAKGLMALLAFLAGFGIVHVPAALILFFKHARHEGRS
jgi:hypothetical protein